MKTLLETRKDFLAHFTIEDFVNPITRVSIEEKLEQITIAYQTSFSQLIEPEVEDAYEEYKSEAVRSLKE